MLAGGGRTDANTFPPQLRTRCMFQDRVCGHHACARLNLFQLPRSQCFLLKRCCHIDDKISSSI